MRGLPREQTQPSEPFVAPGDEDRGRHRCFGRQIERNEGRGPVRSVRRRVPHLHRCVALVG